MNIKKLYVSTMAHERDLSKNPWSMPNADEIYNTAKQIAEFAKSGTVRRSYTTIYGLTSAEVVFESDGAHTNLMVALVDRALSFIYGPDVMITEDGYSYREVMEAARRHDLPENVIGDIPDNGGYDTTKKEAAEREYYANFNALSPSRERDFETKVSRLLYEMAHQSSATGRLLYVADKVSAVIINLHYDSRGFPALRHCSDPTRSERDKEEMALCDITTEGGYCYASEMWTVDYLKIRHLVDYDEDGYLTAILIMYTLQVKGRWYDWRKRDYQKDYS